MVIEIKKIKQFPPVIREDDEVVATGKELKEVPLLLAELGFNDCKTKIIEGTMIYYKSRTNMVYIKYIK